jgi:hypothetical protein
MESRFGHDFSQVRVHTDDQAAASATAVKANAYTMQNNVVFASGQYQPQSNRGQRLLAHELTHVVQQTQMPGHAPISSHGTAEQEAQQNSQQIIAGAASPINARSANGQVQREDKKDPSGKFTVSRGGSQKGEEVKNNFGFDAELKVPLTSDLSFGAVSFLESLKISAKGSKESSEPIPLSDTELSLLQAQIALDLARLELLKMDLGLGELGVTSTLGASGSFIQPFGEEGEPGGSLCTSAGVEASLKTKPLLLGGFGELELASKVWATGSLTQTFGPEEKGVGKAEGSASFGTTYKTPTLRGPIATFGGLLGESATLSLGAEAAIKAGIDTEGEESAKVSAGGSVGLTGKTGAGSERFIKVKVTGDAALDTTTGKIDPASTAKVVDASVGFTF